MPNDGTYFTGQEPAEQTIARKKEKARTLEALPILKVILARLEASIAELDSVSTMPDNVKKDPTAFMNMHNAREIATNYLLEEKQYIEGLMDTHAKNL